MKEKEGSMRESERAFDTLSYVKQLQKVGFTMEQAEVQAHTFLTLIETHWVTKRDLQALEMQLAHKVKELETVLRQEHMVLQRDIKALETALQREIQALEITVQRDLKAIELSTTQQVELLRRDMKESDNSLRRDVKEMELSMKKEMELIRRDMEVMRRNLKIWLGTGLSIAVAVLGGMMTYMSQLS